MTSGASNFLLNIIELQNTITTASGLSPVATLSNTVSKLQEMLIYDEKRLAVNTISKFNTSPIQVVDPINFASNVTGGGTASASFGQVSSIGNVSSFTNYYNTISSMETAISFQVGGAAQSPITLTAGGLTTIAGPLRITGGSPGIGYYLTCMDTVGTAQWQPPGNISDQRWKTDIRPLEDAWNILEHIRGVRFRWSDGGARDVGVIAQDLIPILPEAVIEGVDGRPFMVQYNKIIPVLVECIKNLEARVKTLESKGA